MGSRFQVHEDYVARAESLLPLAHEDSYICAMRDKILTLRERRAHRGAAREESEAEMSAAEVEAPEPVKPSVELETARPEFAPTPLLDGGAGGGESGEARAPNGADALGAAAARADAGEVRVAAAQATVASAPMVIEPTAISSKDTTVVAAEDSTDHADVVSMDTGPEDADSAESAPGDGVGTSAASGGSDASGEAVADKGDADDAGRAAGDLSLGVEPDPLTGGVVVEPGPASPRFDPSTVVEPPAAHDEVDADTEPEDMSDESDGESIITMLTEEDTMCSSGERARARAESSRLMSSLSRARAVSLSRSGVDAARGACVSRLVGCRARGVGRGAAGG